MGRAMMASVAEDVRKLHQAATAEARHGYGDLQGRTARFSAFVAATLAALGAIELARAFAGYGALPLPERESLVGRLLAALPALRMPAPLPARLPEADPGHPSARSPGQSGSPRIQPPPAPADGSWRDQDVQFVKGVGPRFAHLLARVGVHTVEDLLAYYPRHHLDCHQLVKIRDLAPGQGISLIATIRRVEAFSPPRKPNMTILTLTLADGTGTVLARWFHGKLSRPRLEQLKGRFPVEARVLLSGEARLDTFSGKLAFERPEIELLSGEGEADSGRVFAVYPLTEGLTLRPLRKAIRQVLDAHGDAISDPLPPDCVAELGLLPRAAAVRRIHFPKDLDEVAQARRRLVFEELFWLQLALAYRRAQLARREQAVALPRKGDLVERLLAALPFRLTRAQARVFEEVCRDMAASKPMNRLVQGDVGSGKTVVALLSLLVAVENGYQGALMAPTEILAEQHLAKFREWLAPLGVAVVPLLGKQSKKEREQAARALETGYARLAVGTHALLSDPVKLPELGLVVIDEQHRFGVEQRAKLASKGLHPQVLTMTATPIPRTLALTMHGDLDVSSIDELPPGRKPIRTRWVTGERGRKEALALIQQEVLSNRQAYVVLPLVNDSEELANVQSAMAEYEQLVHEDLPHLRIGLLHGQLPADEKHAVIQAFRHGELDVLVATSVIEVGVDVPNASVMVIEHAERFGLSQLHQLRGRVGRGADQSHCVLVTGGRGELVEKRMEVLVATQDGFTIAQQDLELRGPGEFLGTRQSGVPDLLLADLLKDTELVEEARRRAWALVDADPELARYPELAHELLRHHRNNLGFLGIG